MWLLNATPVGATAVAPEEMARKESWVARNFQAPPPATPEPGLWVVTNHDAVTLNGRGGQPMHLGGQPYSRGLYCHAVSKVLVRLPSPGKTFEAIVGVDSNDQTIHGQGSVVFSVTVNGRELFKSPVMREGAAGIPVRVDLGAATSFTLDVGDAGDGIACDQSDWLNAKVILASGQELWLGDLPFVDEPPSGPPFSFVCGGRSSSNLLASSPRQEAQRKLDDTRTERSVSWTDSKTGLLVQCVAVDYRDFPTVEWTLYFKNTGAEDSEILSDIQALNTSFRRRPEGEFLLRHWAGSQASMADYRPEQTTLGSEASLRLAPDGGRGSGGVWPYFDLDWGGEGVLVAVGWPGRWAATFARDGGTKLRVLAGQELTHFKLHPGEEVRSPLIVLQFWQGGDWIRAQNVWRRWMLAHNVPRPGGNLPQPFTATCVDDGFPGLLSTAEGEIKAMDDYVKHRAPLDYWWIDAGWYPADTQWVNTGTWEPDPKRYPHGVREVFDHAHQLGMKTVLWHEPERVTPGTWLWETHPEWLLVGPDPNTRLLNLGNPEAWCWLVEHFDRHLSEQGVDVYRQDFNLDPLNYWRGADTEDRQGITEIKHLTGYLAFWDELCRRHPDLLIDSCASGGRRNDLETMRRAVPLLVSDYRFEPVGTQGHNYGISSWIPFHGTGVLPSTPYVMRSHFRPCYAYGGMNQDPKFDYQTCIRMAKEWRQIADNLLGDYYPLTGYSLAQDIWMAWQYDRPEAGQGVVQAFRHAGSPYEAARFKLRGLDPAANYQLHNFDVEGDTTSTGRQLMELGLLVTLKDTPSSAVIRYRRL
jgi:alpha-galactosidase